MPLILLPRGRKGILCKYKLGHNRSCPDLVCDYLLMKNLPAHTT